MSRFRREAAFLGALWHANLLAALEYRVAFLTQALGMMLNNAAFFAFWVIFFQRFHAVRGWRFHDVLLTYGMLATAFGAAVFLFGNVMRLSTVIAEGELDHYLSLPRPVLLHSLASKSQPSGAGDMLFGFIALFLSGPAGPADVGRFMLAALLGATVFGGALIAAHSISFWAGGADLLAGTLAQGMINFGTYPLRIYGGWTRLLVFTIVPAALAGALPASLVRTFSWGTLGEVAAAAALFAGLGITLFHRGLRSYQSGSAIQLRV